MTKIDELIDRLKWAAKDDTISPGLYTALNIMISKLKPYIFEWHKYDIDVKIDTTKCYFALLDKDSIPIVATGEHLKHFLRPDFFAEIPQLPEEEK